MSSRAHLPRPTPASVLRDAAGCSFHLFPSTFDFVWRAYSKMLTGEA